MNIGVTLYNIQGMRRTYNDFVEMAFSEAHIQTGFYYGSNEGVLYDGALNLMYIRTTGTDTYDINIIDPIIFNWRPYWSLPQNRKTSIVHFHGPSALDYMNHFTNPTNDNPIYKEMFDNCDKIDISESCQLWVNKWIKLHSKLELGFAVVK